ncbi:CBS domain-containing protein, partial [Streptomyces sp. NPDC058953]|uniref:CBS domain-containing protein n=1 Tax=Streptomyces sp. NPDC058953 TaxID=3346676 RepID=UPI0036C10B7E
PRPTPRAPPRAPAPPRPPARGGGPAGARPAAPPPGVRATTPLDDVLTAMQRSGTHLAAVLDEDDAPEGLVTMEDVLRELVGRTD